jgi:hypothetical protein
MMGNKQRLKNGLEYDVIYAKSKYCYLANLPHLVRWTKKVLSKRRRRDAKKELREYDE